MFPYKDSLEFVFQGYSYWNKNLNFTSQITLLGKAPSLRHSLDLPMQLRKFPSSRDTHIATTTS